ncbi:hypothetical protein CTAYLR_007275 [Chrysophaeum taylorii]|uniref:Anoctamin transmembrane domain-containing protein n=1 Tax=Chrysophaeum taylorii TaxID=2483200 RepID=A0AAD7UIJ4_9STRA|nr:hypothetical protein CTAYLR_007275 [Chrysophaeum taylorii]
MEAVRKVFSRPLLDDATNCGVGNLEWDVVIVLPHKITKPDDGFLMSIMMRFGLYNKEKKAARKAAKKAAKKKAKHQDEEDEEKGDDFEIDVEEGAPNDAMFKRLVSRLAASGLEYTSYYSVQGDEVYVKIRCPEKRLRDQADAIDFSMNLAESKLVLEIGFPSFAIAPIEIGTTYDGESISSLRPYEHIYAKYDTNPELEPLYALPKNATSPFRSMHRIKLLTNILQTSRRFGGCEIPLPKRILQGRVLAYLPMHDPVERTSLENKWWSASLFDLPYDDMKNYFGEALGLYFRFLGFVTCYCIVLGVPGTALSIVLWIIGYNSGPPSGILRAIYAISLVVWCALASGGWRRCQKFTALKWGMTNFEQAEPPRPQHKGSIIKSPINGKLEVWFPASKRRGRVITGAFVSLAMIVVVLVFSFLVLRWRISGANTFSASVVQAVGIQVFNFLYRSIAIKQTNAENWRTETEFADRLTTKLFAFNFVNSYFSLLISIFNNSDRVCKPRDCIQVIEIQLLTIFVVALATNVFVSVGLPKLTRLYNQYREGGFKDTLSLAEWHVLLFSCLQYLLVEYDETLDSIQAYMSLVVQFGYVVLFSSAAPLVGLLAALSNIVLLKLEALKYLTGYRRIEPRGAEDIGMFEGIITFLGLVSPVTNFAIVVNNSPPFDALSPLALRRYVFVISAAIAIVLQLILRSIVMTPDGDVELQLQRQDFLRDKVINKVADEEEKVSIVQTPVNDTVAEKDAPEAYVLSLNLVMQPAAAETATTAATEP